MATGDIFTFCQNDLQNKSFAAFQEMRIKEQFCDMTIKLQNRSIIAHRVIVAAGIPYFQKSFDLTVAESEEKEILVQDNLDPTALESLILFAYTSKVDITTENAQSLLVAAQLLGLDEIRDSCSEFISKRLNIHNVGQVQKLANSLKNSCLIANCNRYILKNFEHFLKTPDFLSLSFSCLKGLISQNDLVVSSEEVVFEAIMKWAKFSPSDREIELPRLLIEVRMIYLPLPYLMKKVDTEELVINSKRCRDLVNEAKYCYLLPEAMPEYANLKTVPRNCFMPSLYTICSCKVPDSNSDSQLSVFILVNNKWLPVASTHVLCLAHKVIAANGKIYIFLDVTVLIFDPGNQEWERLKPVRESIVGTAAVLHGRKIYCFGSLSLMNKMRILDTESNEWGEAKEMKTRRWNAAAAPLGEFIYVTGGYDVDAFAPINTVEKYSPSKDQWTDAVPMLIRRVAHGCTSMNGKIYVCGGMDSLDSTLNVAEVYDPATDKWLYISPLQSRKNVVSLIVHCNRMYAFGRKDIEVYEPETDGWKWCSSVPTELQGAVSISTSSIHNDQAE